VVCEHTERAWQYWLSRRSHKGQRNWQKLEGFLRQKLPLPKPRSIHNLSQGQGQQRDAPNGVSPVWFAIGASFWLRRHRMRATFTSGSVGRAPGNRCLYPECSGREGLNLTGESPVVPIARFRHVAIPQFVVGNHTFFAWRTRPGCPEDFELLR